VLKGIDLNIKNNEFLAIQGPSGAGKSTLLHILGGLDCPTRGEALFEGVNIYNLSESERALFRNRKIGFVFQFYHLLPELSALENVFLPRLLKSWWEKTEAADYARSLLGNLGLMGRLHHRPNELSGGEQQRVAIARAMINEPEVLLCDEPTGNLDSENGKNILNLLKKINREGKATVVLVTHDKDIAAVADRVVYLKDGVLVN
jgi:ABC-type lipoprotein export system ATPase subunit